MLRLFLIAYLFAFTLCGSASAAVVFYEDFGTTAPPSPGSTLSINDYTGLSSGLDFEGTAVTADTPVSPSFLSSGYPTASGGSQAVIHLDFQQVGSLVVRGIDTTPFLPGTFELSFGYMLGLPGTLGPAPIEIFASTDDIEFLLVDTFQPLDQNGWQFYESAGLQIPLSTSLNIYLDVAVYNDNHLDDLRLSGASVPEPAGWLFLSCSFGSLAMNRRSRRRD
tara:strand:+ start:128 stop:793 length:666 start_codon:yes stop_codon:yes gene_type:complete